MYLASADDNANYKIVKVWNTYYFISRDESIHSKVIIYDRMTHRVPSKEYESEGYKSIERQYEDLLLFCLETPLLPTDPFGALSYERDSKRFGIADKEGNIVLLPIFPGLKLEAVNDIGYIYTMCDLCHFDLSGNTMLLSEPKISEADSWDDEPSTYRTFHLYNQADVDLILQSPHEGEHLDGAIDPYLWVGNEDYRVFINDYKFGLISKDGKVIIKERDSVLRCYVSNYFLTFEFEMLLGYAFFDDLSECYLLCNDKWVKVAGSFTDVRFVKCRDTFFAMCTNRKQDYKCTLYSLSGLSIISEPMDYIGLLNINTGKEGDYHYIWRNGHKEGFGIITKPNNTLFNPKFHVTTLDESVSEELNYIDYGFFAYKQNGKWGIAHFSLRNYEKITQPIYDSISIKGKEIIANHGSEHDIVYSTELFHLGYMDFPKKESTIYNSSNNYIDIDDPLDAFDGDTEAYMSWREN